MPEFGLKEERLIIIPSHYRTRVVFISSASRYVPAIESLIMNCWGGHGCSLVFNSEWIFYVQRENVKAAEMSFVPIKGTALGFKRGSGMTSQFYRNWTVTFISQADGQQTFLLLKERLKAPYRSFKLWHISNNCFFLKYRTRQSY